MTAEVLVQVEQLTRRYGEIQAVDQINFTLRRGEVLGFLGPNGAGKSTTMRMLAGVLTPHEGRIVIAGADLLDEPRRARQEIGYLPEQAPLYHELTVDEQLYYSARLHGLSRTASRQAVAWAKARCGLEDVSRRLLGNLSKGYQQRVGIAQAILHNPAVIILDEPTVGLDPIQIREIRALIRELGQEHGVILSTHLLPEVQAICTHVQILYAGRLVYASALADLERRPSGCLQIRLEAPPPITVLSELPAVAQVEELGSGRFHLHHTDSGTEPIRTLVAQACAKDWGLRELTPEYASLEHIFVELTLGQRIIE